MAALEVSRAAVAKLHFGDTAVTETTGDVTKIDPALQGNTFSLRIR